MSDRYPNEERAEYPESRIVIPSNQSLGSYVESLRENATQDRKEIAALKKWLIALAIFTVAAVGIIVAALIKIYFK